MICVPTFFVYHRSFRNRCVVDHWEHFGECNVGAARLESVLKLHETCSVQLDDFGGKHNIPPGMQSIVLSYSFRLRKILEKCDVNLLRTLTQVHVIFVRNIQKWRIII